MSKPTHKYACIYEFINILIRKVTFLNIAINKSKIRDINKESIHFTNVPLNFEHVPNFIFFPHTVKYFAVFEQYKKMNIPNRSALCKI